MSLSGTGNGKKGAQHRVHRGHRECEVTDEIFATSGAAPAQGCAMDSPGIYAIHESRVTSHLRATRPPWNLRFTQLWRGRERDVSGDSEEQGLRGPLSRSS